MARIPRRIARINVLQHGLTPDGEVIEPVVEETVKAVATPTTKKKSTKKSSNKTK